MSRSRSAFDKARETQQFEMNRLPQILAEREANRPIRTQARKDEEMNLRGILAQENQGVSDIGNLRTIAEKILNRFFTR